MKRNPVAIFISFSSIVVACHAQTQITIWGDNTYGQKNVPPDATNVVALAAGDSHCLALRRDGTVIAWGRNSQGQTNVPSDLTNAVSIAAGATHSLALRSDGTVSFWGHFSIGGTPSVPTAATNVVALALGPGAAHAVVLRADGTVVDWGGSSSSTNIPATAVDLVSVAAGSFHTLALRSDGKVIAWGDNSFGQLNVPASATNVVAIAAGWYGNALLRADGTTLLWGGASPPPSFGFTNLVELVCPFNSVSSSVGVLALRRNGSLTQFQGSPGVPAYPTNQIAVIAAGSFDGFAAVGSGAPVFPGLPVNRIVPAGSRAYFRMNAAGQLPLFYQWNCNGTNVPGATNSVLVLSNVQPQLAGTYYTLTASNSVGTNISGAMFLQVEPLEITMQPRGLTVLPGTNVTFTSSAIGQGPFAYQWQFAGTNLDGSTNSSLALTNVQMNQAGVYSLIVSNAFGSVTNYDALLNVVPLFISIQPQNLSVLAGTNILYMAIPVGQGPFSFQWRFNDTNLDSAMSGNLYLTNVSPIQAGTYSVVGSNAFGAVVSPAVNLSIAPASIRNQPLSQTVPIGTNATFSVIVDSLVPVSYQWQYNGTNISGATTNPLVVSNVQLENAGQFSVVVSNTFGTVTSSNALLTVAPLQIASQPQSQIGYVELTAAFTVVPVFQGPFSYQWQFMGTNISDATGNQLLLTNLQMNQSGTYTVIVSNAFGSVKSMDALLDVRAIAAWGDNSYNQTNVPLSLTNPIAIAASYGLSMALTKEHNVIAWGWNNYNRTNVPIDITNAIAIAAGYSHCLALMSNGTLRVWGSYFDGTNYYSAVSPPDLTNVVAIAAGNYHAVALKSDGTVTAWGYNYYGQTNVPTGLKNVVSISAGGYYSLALKSDGTVVGWGSQGWGETNMPQDLSNVVAISAGIYHGLALKADGTVVGWGDNAPGEIDLPPDLTNVVVISGGNFYSTALRADGSIVVWGSGPTNVPPNLTSARAVAAGDIHTLALSGVPTTMQPINASWAGSNFTLSFPSASGKVYLLEYKDSLTDSAWKPLPLNAGNGGMLILSDPSPRSVERFYRIRQW